MQLSDPDQLSQFGPLEWVYVRFRFAFRSDLIGELAGDIPRYWSLDVEEFSEITQEGETAEGVIFVKRIVTSHVGMVGRCVYSFTLVG